MLRENCQVYLSSRLYDQVPHMTIFHMIKKAGMPDFEKVHLPYEKLSYELKLTSSTRAN